MSDAAHLTPGSLFARQYTVTRVGASRAHGVDYVAKTPAGRFCRLSVLHPHLVASPADAARFRERMQTAKNHQSPAFAELFDAGIDAETGSPFVASEWLTGSPLRELVKARGPLPHEEVRDVLRQLAEALTPLHRAGGFHGALDPDVLFFEPATSSQPRGSLRVRLADLGLGLFLRERPPVSQLTRAEFIAWSPPELLVQRPEGPPQPRTDVWAIAMLAYFALAGRGLLDDVGKTLTDRVLKLVSGPLPLPSERFQQGEQGQPNPSLGRGLPPAFDAWFRRCTALKPDERFATADEAWGAIVNVPWGARPRLRTPMATPIHDDAEVTPSDWAAMFEAHLPPPFERTEPAPGKVRLATPTGITVEIDAESRHVEAGHVEWTLPPSLTAAAAAAIVDAVVRAAQALKAEPRVTDSFSMRVRRVFGRDTDPSLHKLLIDKQLPPPPPTSQRRPDPFAPAPLEIDGPRAVLDERGLTLSYVHQAWVTSHQLGPASTEYAHLPRAKLPASPTGFANVVDALASAGHYMNERPVRPCRFCHRKLPPLHMHDANTCHSCAELYLGVIH